MIDSQSLKKRRVHSLKALFDYVYLYGFDKIQFLLYEEEIMEQIRKEMNIETNELNFKNVFVEKIMSILKNPIQDGVLSRMVDKNNSIDFMLFEYCIKGSFQLIRKGWFIT